MLRCFRKYKFLLSYINTFAKTKDFRLNVRTHVVLSLPYLYILGGFDRNVFACIAISEDKLGGRKTNANWRPKLVTNKFSNIDFYPGGGRSDT